MQRVDFDITYRGKDIFTIHTKRSGVSYSSEYAFIDTAIAAGYSLEQFRELDGQSQSELIAWHEGKGQIESVLSEVNSKPSSS